MIQNPHRLDAAAGRLERWGVIPASLPGLRFLKVLIGLKKRANVGIAYPR